MSLSVTYNDINLNELIGIRDEFNAFNTSAWDNELRSTGNSNGSSFLYASYGSKTIEMPFYIKGDALNKYDKLLAILNVAEPKKLSFSIYPNRYFLAKLSDNVEFTPLGKNDGKGTIKWIVPDGVSHSIDTKIVTANVVNGVLTANIDYQGSEETYPTFKIKHNDENGYIGIVQPNGVLEIGNRKESDTETLSKAAVILNTKDFLEFNPYKGINSENPEKSNSGFNGISTKNGEKFYGMADSGANNGYWHGGSSVFEFPADGTGKVGSKNVYCYFNLVFWALKNGQTGQFQILFMDKNDNLVMGYDIYKIDGTGNTGNYTALVGDGKGGKKILKMQAFPTDHLDNHNPFNFTRGHSDIYKIGDTIRFYWAGSYPVFKVPELKDVEITKCYVNFYQLKNRSGDQLMSFFDLRNILIRNDTAEYINDIPNRYAKGSEVIINSESDEISVNGLPANGELITGSKFSPIVPGKNKIEFYTSSWIKSSPTITVEYKERWL